MLELSPKIKLLIIGAAFLLAAIVAAVVVVVVQQKNNVAKIKSIAFESANEQMMVGEQKQFSVTIYPSDAQNKDLLFSSSNTSVVRIVSVSGNTVTVEAVAVGQAKVIATAKANRAITDSFNIEVADNVAESILFEQNSYSAHIGEEIRIPVTLSPQESNYQKLTIVSYNASLISAPQIILAQPEEEQESDNENSEGQPQQIQEPQPPAEIVFSVVGSGSGQIVVGFTTERNGQNVVVLYSQIEVVGLPTTIETLSFEVKSNSITEYVAPSAENNCNNNFLLSDTTTVYYFKIKYKDANNVWQGTTDATCQYNNTIFDVQLVGNDYVVRLKPNASTDWGFSNIVFEYSGQSLALNFVQASLPSVSFGDTVLSNTTLYNNKTYLLELSANTKRLIEYGFAHIELDKDYSEIELESGVLLKCKSTKNNMQVGFILTFTYWNNSTPGVQKDISITITNQGYTED